LNYQGDVVADMDGDMDANMATITDMDANVADDMEDDVVLIQTCLLMWRLTFCFWPIY